MAPAEGLDPHRSTPLWAQLAAVLRARLAAGEYAERFPTEMELTTEFEVSRATVREAIRRLKDDGLLDARRGSGTFVVRGRLEQTVLGAPGLARTITAAGLDEESEVLGMTEQVPGESARTALGLEPGERAVQVERVRWAGGHPVAIDSSVVALDEQGRRDFLAADLGRGSIYDVLAERCGLQVTGATEQVRAVQCTESEREILRLGDDEGVLEVERVAYAGARPVEWRRSLLRGSAYVLAASWGVVPEHS